MRPISLRFLVTLLLVGGVLNTELCFGEVQLQYKKVFTVIEQRDLCELENKEWMSEQLSLKILNSPELPRKTGCRWVAVDFLGRVCREVDNKSDFLACVDRMLPYLESLDFYLPLEKKEFIAGDILLKASRLSDERSSVYLIVLANILEHAKDYVLLAGVYDDVCEVCLNNNDIDCFLQAYNRLIQILYVLDENGSGVDTSLEYQKSEMRIRSLITRNQDRK